MDKIVASIPKYPTREECLIILRKHHVEERVLRHTQEVARVAGIISEYLNSQGLCLHLGFIYACALLHDIAKGTKEHARRGKDILIREGYPEVAEVIAVHMDLPQSVAKSISETSIVYLADKMVHGSGVVPLSERLRLKQLQYEDNDKARECVTSRLKNAMQVEKLIVNTLGVSLEEILGLSGKAEGGA